MPELLTRRENAIGWIVICNPQQRNAVTYEMLRALPEAIAGHERDAAVRVMALTGEGSDSFACGADYTEFAATRGSPPGRRSRWPQPSAPSPRRSRTPRRAS